MRQKQTIKRSAATGRFVTRPLGQSKASKFAAVEGMSLNRKSSETLKTLKSRGLKGAALRTAITGSFKTKPHR